MMYIKQWIYAIGLGLLIGLAACSDEVWENPDRQEVDLSLLGRAVNFSASYVEPFLTKATTFNTDGKVNEGDILSIYRQYATDDGKGFDTADEAYRIYHYVSRTAAGGVVMLNREWMVKTGEWARNKPNGTPFQQTLADSMVWETDATLRFRAWGLSNYAGVLISEDSWDRFYPDFTVCDWVQVSGPTERLSLPMRHLGCRIAFLPKVGNQLFRVQICTEPEDYQWDDNAGESADDPNEDEKDKLRDEEAQEVAAAVKAVFEKMCMPGGVDMQTGGLLAMSQTYKNEHPKGPGYYKEADFSNIFQNEMVKFGTKGAAAAAVRPLFNTADVNMYMVTIPYDMETGELITLPAQTRFRVYIRDVNGGDGASQTGKEWEGGQQYHILSLSDIKREDGTPAFPNGLLLEAGYSYEFKVGYHYNKLQVKLSETLSWNEQDARRGTAQEEESLTPTSTALKWWKDAVDKAIQTAAAGSGDFNPEFHISTESEFAEFVGLVNGYYAKTEPLYNAYRAEINPERAESPFFTESQKHVFWYTGFSERGDTLWATRAELESQGYIFYNLYHPSDGDNAAFTEENYMQGAYSFFNVGLNRSFWVYLDRDLDFKDYYFESPVGKSEELFFGGYLSSKEGEFHRLRNVNVAGGYLFHYAKEAVISNLLIESNHTVGVVDQGVDTRLIGISLKANSPAGGGLARSLTGNSYVIGCIQEGSSGGPLVGSADNLTMYACMQTLPDLTGGALLGHYAGSTKFFAPQAVASWGNFNCNYYDIDRSPQATPVEGHAATAYLPQQYIRGLRTNGLCALLDILLEKPGLYNYLTSNQKIEFYGLAPWKAMNAAMNFYNTSIGMRLPCRVHYQVNELYNNRYPQLVAGAPTESIEVPKQYN